MRMVCWQTILMKEHILFFSKIRKDIQYLSSPAVVIGALKVNDSMVILNQGLDPKIGDFNYGFVMLQHGLFFFDERVNTDSVKSISCRKDKNS